MLYIVGTPIGNMEDLSLRQAKTITSAEIIVTEDTRSTGMLLKRIEELFHLSKKPECRLISYYQDKEFEKLPEIISLLEVGKEIVLISESGMPLISDPGYLLVKEVIKRKIPYTVIPGPTAVVTALAHSGFKLNHFTFFGFLPRKKGDVNKTLLKAQEVSLLLGGSPIVFYESANRLNETLLLLDVVAPNAHVCVCRELTKMYEEILRGTPKELSEMKFRGEIVLVISF
ncbi:16S rRNA (cytidine(1402)-2'-O)-methyltransferase [Candidatus Roizmanbacteria bacterium]|nr:16S rRNA (cytidine(1402)-2'-O)-methyltransferase [Candidatus Roizmanbacteria bacterium]